MLRIAGIEHDMFETTSATFVNEWINNYSAADFPYTDFICVGGDGMFSQLINSIGTHPDKDEFFKIPIGIMPCGSQNAVSCDIGGKNPYNAAVRILRGVTIQGDMLRIKFKGLDIEIYGTAFLWGVPGELVNEAQKWRSIFGSCRYTICGIKQFLCNWNLKSYNCNIHFKPHNKFELTPSTAYHRYQDEEEVEQEEEEKSTIPTEFKDESTYGRNDILNVNDINCSLVETKKDDEEDDVFASPLHDWNPHHVSRFLFVAILTHEARSSMSSEIFVPHARFDDSKMYIAGIRSSGKVQTLKMLNNMQGGRHVKMDEFSVDEASEVRLKPLTNTFINIDGEIYPNDEVHVKLLRGGLNLIGKTADVDESLKNK